MLLSWNQKRGFAAAPGRAIHDRRGAARFAHTIPVSEGLLPLRRDVSWVRPAYRRRDVWRRRLARWLIAAVALMTAALIANSAALRLNGAVVLARREIPGMPVFFRQDDPAWAGDTMGAPDRTLGKAGDGVSCLASLVEMQQLPAPFEGAVDPGTVNAWLCANGAYDRKGDLDWSKAAKLLGVQLVERQPGWGVARTMESLLQREIYPVLRVKLRDTGAYHDVLAVGTVHGEFVIMDPLDSAGIPNSLSIYDNRIYSVKYLI